MATKAARGVTLVLLAAALVIAVGSGCGSGASPSQQAASAAQRAEVAVGSLLGGRAECDGEGWMVFVGEREKVYGCTESDTTAIHPRCYVVIEGEAQDVTDDLVDSVDEWPCAREERAAIEAAEQEAAEEAAQEAAAREAKALEKELKAAEREAELDTIQTRVWDASDNHENLYYKGWFACGKPKYFLVTGIPRAKRIAAGVATELGSTPTEREAIAAGCLSFLLEIDP